MHKPVFIAFLAGSARTAIRGRALVFLFVVATLAPLRATEATPMAFIDAQIAAHPGQSGVRVLDTGAEGLLARAWLADHARRSIDVQYFIWSTDNIGILAAEALLRAAERGVRVRVIVDDLLIDAPDQSLLALARHPNVDIRIYNPQTSVGIALARRLWNIVSNFRGVNQRMHDKTVIVDGKIAITGGRNMAAEYYDYNHTYNFRDRDALVLGPVVEAMQASFEAFWRSDLAVKVEDLYGYVGLGRKHVQVTDAEIARIYRELHAYAALPENFEPEVRAAIASVPSAFADLARQVVWDRIEFVSDAPGKNQDRRSLSGGGRSTTMLAQLVANAEKSVVIQSPYLVFSEDARALFERLIARGVRVRINTNSLAATDNLPAFSGYRSQREQLVRMGLAIYEYRPDPAVERARMAHFLAAKEAPPVFSLHAKTLVVDGRAVYIGTFNFDPRSQNLNTEVGVVVYNDALAGAVQSAIETDMQPGNSWNAAADDPDRYAPWAKRATVRLLQLLPLESLL